MITPQRYTQLHISHPSQKSRTTLLPLVLDALTLVAVFLVAYGLRSWWGDQLQPFSFYVPLLVAGVAAFAIAGLSVALYDSSRPLFSLSYIAGFLQAYFMWGFFIVAFPFFVKIQYSRTIILFLLVFSFIALYVLRLWMAWLAPVSREEDEAEVKIATGNLSELLRISSDPLSVLYGIHSVRQNEVALAAKRIVDLVCVAIAAVPVLIATPIIAAAILRDSPGPIFIVQKRVGKDGKEFTMYKFRTMFQTAGLYAPAPRKGEDPRVTRVGKILRKTSLDELPQFWNVFIGNMSIVGPRPEMPFIVDRYEPWQRARLQVTPGITGLWQIFGRKDLPLEENLEYDLYYVFNQSFFLDCAIMLKTIPHLMSSKGAY